MKKKEKKKNPVFEKKKKKCVYEAQHESLKRNIFVFVLLSLFTTVFPLTLQDDNIL